MYRRRCFKAKLTIPNGCCVSGVKSERRISGLIRVTAIGATGSRDSNDEVVILILCCTIE